MNTDRYHPTTRLQKSMGIMDRSVGTGATSTLAPALALASQGYGRRNWPYLSRCHARTPQHVCSRRVFVPQSFITEGVYEQVRKILQEKDAVLGLSSREAACHLPLERRKRSIRTSSHGPAVSREGRSFSGFANVARPREAEVRNVAEMRDQGRSTCPPIILR